jgi:hypothetical protein
MITMMFITITTATTTTIIIQFQFFIYLRAEFNSQWPITESAWIQTTAIRQHRAKQTTKTTTKETTNQRNMDQLRLFTLKYDLLKVSVDLQTAFAGETHLGEGQWLKEQLNVLKLRTFRVGTRMPTVRLYEYDIKIRQNLFQRKQDIRHIKLSATCKNRAMKENNGLTAISLHSLNLNNRWVTFR